MRLSAIAISAFLLISLVVSSQEPGVRQVRKTYEDAIGKLDAWIAEEIAVKKIPSLAIAVVDDQEVVWAKAFGFEDPQLKRPATTQTLYRVGSVSKPVTALLLMLLVELGMIDLDMPVSKYLPEFQPKNPYDKKITLRQMLSHRSGLIRESPVGNYFDDSNPSLAATVKSLNKTELIYEPENKTSYSNAALAVVGRVIERTLKQDFATAIQRKLLNPIGMTHSSFAPTEQQRRPLAKALMWTYHGREFAAPTFDLGMAPAGCLYSNADDMANFLRFLFARGKGPNGRVLKASTLKQMWKPQFVEPGTKSGFGLGFYVSEFEGRLQIRHGGAIYGFSTEFSALPDDKLGVIVMSSKDVSNAVTRNISKVVLEHMLAVKQGKKLPQIVQTKPVEPKLARKLAGRYQSGKKVLELIESNGRLFFLPLWEGRRIQVRQAKNGLITDGLLGYGTKIKVEGDNVRVDDDLFERVKVRKPHPVPKKWLGLIGEYGWDYNTLYILEKDGRLFTLIEWVFLYPLEEVNENVYKFPDFGLYQGDKLVFTRDKNGRAIKVDAASVPFIRRDLKGEGGKLFTLDPLQPVEKLRKAALAATPPKEKGKFRKPDLVDLAKLDKNIKLDIRYAGKNNFLETPFYTSAKAFMQRPAAEALLRVHKKLAKKGYGLWIFDAYRPWHVTKMFWDAAPAEYKHFVADPKKGSRHNRGCAVDLTLYELKSGKVVDMVSGFDEFSDRAYPDYMGGTALQRWHRDLLRRAMEEEGFSVYDAEWWHYDFRDWREYPILNLTFGQL